METAVSQEQYARMMGFNPSILIGEDCPESFKMIEVNGKKIAVCSDHPVHNTSWHNAEGYAKRISSVDPKYNYYLAEEEQLEVAFRGATITAFVGGDDASNIGDYLWYLKNSQGHCTHAVKSKKANGYGVFSSGIREWSNSWYNPAEFKSPSIFFNYYRACRGNVFNSPPHHCRSGARFFAYPSNNQELCGFRLVRTPK
jgi:formylglycine-generating enzyme required for sulfatase activity